MNDDCHEAAVEESLRAALLGGPGSTDEDTASREAEARALAAFRTARDTGLHASRPTRPRDDWTPSAQRRRRGRSLKAAVAAVLASVALGGVAIAAADLPDTLPDSPAPAPDTATPVPQDGSTRDASAPPGRQPVPSPPTDPEKTKHKDKDKDKAEKSVPAGARKSGSEHPQHPRPWGKTRAEGPEADRVHPQG